MSAPLRRLIADEPLSAIEWLAAAIALAIGVTIAWNEASLYLGAIVYAVAMW